MELYTVSTLLKTYRGRKDIRVFWKATFRANPIAPYSDLIQDYDQLDELCKRASEEYVNELLSKSEAESLSQFIAINFGLKSDVHLLDVSPIAYEPDIYRDTWEQEAQKMRLKGNPVTGVAITGYYDLEGCAPVPALMDILAEHPLDLIPFRNSKDHSGNEAQRFFDILGKLTGIYFREEDGRLRATLGDEPSFTGGFPELIDTIETQLRSSIC